MVLIISNWSAYWGSQPRQPANKEKNERTCRILRTTQHAHQLEPAIRASQLGRPATIDSEESSAEEHEEENNETEKESDDGGEIFTQHSQLRTEEVRLGSETRLMFTSVCAVP